MAEYDFWAARQRLRGGKLPEGYRCNVCGLTFPRWRQATDHDCADPLAYRRYQRAFWRSVRNNAKRRQYRYKRREAKRQTELLVAGGEGTDD